MRYLNRLTALLALATFFTLTLSATAADDDGKKKKKKQPEAAAGTLVGTISSVNSEATKIIVAEFGSKKAAGATTEIRINDKTKIEYVDIPTDERKLKAGLAVTVTLVDGSVDTAAGIKVSKAVEAPKKKKKDK